MESHKKLFLLALLINALAVLAGVYFYSDQLLQTAPQLLIFVPDCPLYVFLSILIILGIARNDIFSFIVSAGMVKYGLWTVFVILFHWDAYSQPLFLWTSIIFIIGHLGMALEGLALLPKKRISALALYAAIGWFLLNDYMDYAVGTVPPIPREGMATVAALTVAASVLLPLALFAYGSRIANWRAVAFLRGILLGRA
jgi:uncharacterized membrane protein YpjA